MLEDITPLILTWNEGPNIQRTLECLAWAKDIVVVDSFSDDDTPAIVSSFSQTRLFQRKFDDHASQWNFGLQETGIETAWVMALDADFNVPAELVDEIRALESPADIEGYSSRFVFCVNGKKIKSTLCPPVTFLFRREQAEYYGDGHTQKLRLRGRIEKLQTPILHDDRKSFSRWLLSQARYQELDSRKLLNTPSSALDFPDRIRKLRMIAPVAVLFYCLIWRGGLLDGVPGIYYALQRTLAELILSLYLIEADLKRAGHHATPRRSMVAEVVEHVAKKDL
jgi:hypothetical protein